MRVLPGEITNQDLQNDKKKVQLIFDKKEEGLTDEVEIPSKGLPFILHKKEGNARRLA